MGNLTKWRTYSNEQFTTINNLLKISSAPNFDYLQSLNLEIEVVTEWDPPGICEICGRPKGDGRRMTRGHCRFKITQKANTTFKGISGKYEEKLLGTCTYLSCRSLSLNALIPDIIGMTKIIPDFIQVEKCSGICNPDAEGFYKGWQSTKKKGFKYRKTFVLAENAHLTLICPESTLENHVVWKYQNREIKRVTAAENSKQEPKISIDTFNTLYLYDVTKEEEGNYTCYVDDIRMQQVRVFVVSKARLLTQAFLRHMMYLGVVLSLTLTCYCAGLVVTWTRRKKFKSYHKLRQELREANKLIDDDDDSVTDDGGDSDSVDVYSPETIELLKISDSDN